ncbi:MAG: hypothetical protein KA761_02145 [Gemmatimonadaceae bacterium]|nr:hypothetical protein [Gemmatimonadaceae bacterium]
MVTPRAILLLALALAACEDPWAAEDLRALGEPVAFASLEAGTTTSCGLDASGAAWCWGQNTGTDSPRLLCYESLGGAGTSTSWCWDRPVPVSGDLRFRRIAAGNPTIAIDTDGALWGWGFNANHLLGAAAPTTTVLKPMRVSDTGAWRFKAVDVSNTTACGVTEDGRLVCWGEPNMITTGALQTCAAGFGKCRQAPAIIGTRSDWVDVAVGHEAACALDVAGRIACWGLGTYGELGIVSGSTCSVNGVSIRCLASPTPVSATLTFASLGGRGLPNCGITTASALHCWGQIVSGTTIATPTLIQTGVVDFDSNGSGYCTVRTGGTVWCSGLFSPTGSPVQVAVPGAAVGVSMGVQHACAWDAAGNAWCFGDATFGQLGNGDARPVYGPVPRQVSAPYRN